MDLTYVLMDPTGNITALVETPVPVSEQPATAARVMAAEPCCEQVGFLMENDTCDTAIRMAGGEFCGNASMCAAALHAMKLGLTEERTLRVGISGEVVDVTVRPSGGQYTCRVTMPRPLDIVTVDDVPVVRFSGICHAITAATLDDTAAEKLVRQLCAVLNAGAMGLMQLNREAGTMKPLVYVPGADTLFWENSCGSGTAAVGAWLHSLSGQPVGETLRQPGGTLGVEVDAAGNIFLCGAARLMHRSTLS